MIICLCKKITKQDMIRSVINGCESFEKVVSPLEEPGDCKICYSEAKKVFVKLKKAYEGGD